MSTLTAYEHVLLERLASGTGWSRSATVGRAIRLLGLADRSLDLTP